MKTLQFIDGDKVVFKMQTGKEVAYPLEKQSEASREKLAGRFAEKE